jgi:hypothetical protein
MFVTVANQRSGTKAFSSALNAGSVYVSYAELWNLDTDGGSEANLLRGIAECFSGARALFSADGVEAACDRALDLVQGRSSRQVHFDLMYNQIDCLPSPWVPLHPVDNGGTLLRRLKKRGTPILHLRRDVPASVISEMRMLVTGRISLRRDSSERRILDHAGPPWNTPEVALEWALARARQIISLRNRVDEALAGYPPLLNAEYDRVFTQEQTIDPHFRHDLAGLLGIDEKDAGELLGEPMFIKEEPSLDMLETEVDLTRVRQEIAAMRGGLA